MKKRVLQIAAFLSLAAVANESLADSFTATKFPKSFTPISVSSEGYIAGSNTANGIPELYFKETFLGKVGSLDYRPISVNNKGTVAGVQFGGSDTDFDFAIFTPLGQSSIVLRQDLDILGTALDQTNNNVAVIEKDAVNFFSGSTLVGTATAATNQSFADIYPALLLGSGTLVTKINDQGSDRYATVTSAGVITVLSIDVLPQNARILKELNQQVLFFSNGALYLSNLVSPATIVAGPIKGFNTAYLGEDGTKYLGEYDAYSDASNEYANFLSPNILTASSTTPIPLRCFIRKQDKIHPSELQSVLGDGSILVYDYEKYILLTPPKGELTSNCAKLLVRIKGACSKYFKKSDQIKPLPSKVKRCELQATVETASGRPFRNATVVTEHYGSIFARGKTDRNGKLSFSVANSNGTPSVEVMAPYGDKTSYSASVDLYSNFAGSDT